MFNGCTPAVTVSPSVVVGVPNAPLLSTVSLASNTPLLFMSIFNSTRVVEVLSERDDSVSVEELAAIHVRAVDLAERRNAFHDSAWLRQRLKLDLAVLVDHFG